MASPSPGRLAILTAVAAVSRSNAWAVGSYETSSGGNKTLILHWGGARWMQVPSPSPEVTDGSSLTGVSAISASSAWAAGWVYGTGGENSNTLILHWNGTSWSHVPSPNPAQPGNFSVLDSVSALSPSDAWAAGSYSTSNGLKTLALHWNGATWTQVATPNPGGSTGTLLSGVSATSPANVWAVGSASPGSGGTTVILHWNGSSWTQS